MTYPQWSSLKTEESFSFTNLGDLQIKIRLKMNQKQKEFHLKCITVRSQYRIEGQLQALRIPTLCKLNR